MNTSSRFAVATHIMAALAAKRMASGQDQVMKSEWLSASVNTNPVVIRRILGLLRNAGLVHSITGPNGGSVLAQPPEKITLREIYEAVEEGDLFHFHYSCPDQACPVGANIQDCLDAVLDDAESAMKKALARKTLAQVAQQILDRSGILKKIAPGVTLEQLQREYTIRNGKLIKKSKG